MYRRITPFLAAATIVLAACGAAADTSGSAASPDAADSGSGSGSTDSSTSSGSTDSSTSTSGTSGGSTEPFAIDQIESSPRNVTTSGIQAWATRMFPDSIPEPAIDPLELRSGGPPPDGIPPIDSPKFLRAGDVNFLEENEPVLALEIDGEARAYPVQILTWHEIVNDTISGIPVSVTYCPLCNSAVAYDRRLDEQVLVFGTFGLLWNSSLVMYDRQTETLWSHFTGEGIIGELTGEELEAFPLSTVAWNTWRDANPDGLVLSQDTGFDRSYGRNPYPGYDNVESTPFLFEGDVDGRYTAMTRIIGAEHGENAIGVPLDNLRDERVIATDVEGDQLVFWWTEGTTSALDSSQIPDGADVGATGVFIAALDGQTLTFQPTDDGDGFIDDQTGTTWNVLGTAVDGPEAGTQLEGVTHVDTFWFAWSTFRPDTTIVTE